MVTRSTSLSDEFVPRRLGGLGVGGDAVGLALEDVLVPLLTRGLVGHLLGQLLVGQALARLMDFAVVRHARSCRRRSVPHRHTRPRPGRTPFAPDTHRGYCRPYPTRYRGVE